MLAACGNPDATSADSRKIFRKPPQPKRRAGRTFGVFCSWAGRAAEGGGLQHWG